MKFTEIETTLVVPADAPLNTPILVSGETDDGRPLAIVCQLIAGGDIEVLDVEAGLDDAQMRAWFAEACKTRPWETRN